MVKINSEDNSYDKKEERKVFIPPLVYITLSYIIGIILENYLNLNLTFVIILFLTAQIVTIYFFFKRQNLTYLPLIFSFLLLGIILFKITNLLPPNHIAKFPVDKWVRLEGVITDEPIYKENVVNFTLLINRYNEERATGLILVKLNPNLADELKYGVLISVEGLIRIPPGHSNPGDFSYRDYLKKKGIYRTISVWKKENLQIKGKVKTNLLKESAILLKNKIIKFHKRSLSYPYNDILNSIIFGQKSSPLPKEWQRLFQNVGIIHIVAASGLHIFFILSFVLMLFGFSYVRDIRLKFIIIVIASLIIIFYAQMAGGTFSVYRAVIMGVVALGALLLEREYFPYNALSLAALLLLIISPYALFEVSFQLSFTACLGIIYLAPKFINYFKNIKFKIFPNFIFYFLSLCAVTFSAQIFVTPLIIYYFNQFSPFSLFANILILPFVGLILPLGIFLGVLGAISSPLISSGISLLNILNEFLLFLISKIVIFLSHLPATPLYLPTPSLLKIAIFYLILVLLVEYRNRLLSLRPTYYIIFGLILAVMIIWAPLFKSSSLQIFFLDVGQGDCAVIKTPEGKNIMIDTSGVPEYRGSFDTAEMIVLPFLRRYGINRLDLVLLSHPDDDHIGGMSTLLDEIDIRLVVDSCQDKVSDLTYLNILQKIKEKNIPLICARKGMKIDLSKDLEILIFHPDNELLENTKSDTNNNSIVCQLRFKEFKVLFTGDLEEEGENRLLAEDFNLKSHILKVAHHGSKDATSSSFLERVNPEIAVISAGDNNPFGHPHHQVLERLKERKISVFRTDKNGGITIKTNGIKTEVKVVRN